MADGYANRSQFEEYGLPAVALDGFNQDVMSYIAASSAEFDSYARANVNLPLSQPYPLEVVRCVCARAAYDILSIRGFDPEDNSHDNVRTRSENCLRWLERLSEKKVHLPPDSTSPGGSGGAPLVRSRCRDDSRRFRDPERCR